MHTIGQLQNRPTNFIAQNCLRGHDNINSELVIAMKERGEFPLNTSIENKDTSNPCIAIQQKIQTYLAENGITIISADISIGHEGFIGDISPNINYMKIKNYQGREISYKVGDSECDTLFIDNGKQRFSLKLALTPEIDFLNHPDSIQKLFETINSFIMQMNKFLEHYPNNLEEISQTISVEVNNDGIYTLGIIGTRKILTILSSKDIPGGVKWGGSANNNKQFKIICCGRNSKREIGDMPKVA